MQQTLTEKNLEYVIHHVFFPPKLPQQDDYSVAHEHRLSTLVLNLAVEYQDLLIPTEKAQWVPILRTLEQFSKTQEHDSLIPTNLRITLNELKCDDVVALYIRAQNAGLMIKRGHSETIFESFEVSPKNEAILAAAGKLRRAFPGPAIAVSNDTVDSPLFRTELISFVCLMHTEVLDSAPTSRKAGAEVTEIRNTAHPRYITHLLTGILRGMGRPADIVRINKRIADDVLWKDTLKPWRRSPAWMVLRVALQISLVHIQASNQDHSKYKRFVVFLLARLLQLATRHNFPSDLIFCMRAKLARRLHKIGSQAPELLVQYVIDVEKKVEDKLQERWSAIQSTYSECSIWEPEQLNIVHDSFLSLQNSSEYLQRALRGLTTKDEATVFAPQHPPRLCHKGTSLRSFNNEVLCKAFAADTAIALMDFEKIVRDNVDDWVAQHCGEEWAIDRVAELMLSYHSAAAPFYEGNPEDGSLMLLTLFDLWMAMDKLVVGQCPLLAEYSPEVPLHLFESLLLHKADTLIRLTSITTHLRSRYEQVKSSISIFSDALHDGAFGVRFFESSNELQALKRRIEEDAQTARDAKKEEFNALLSRQNDLSLEAQSLEHTYRVVNGRMKHKAKSCRKCRLEREMEGLKIIVHEWPLPQDQLEAKVVIFELRSPSAFRVWRDSTYNLLFGVCNDHAGKKDPPVRLTLQDYSGLKVYRGQFSRITLASQTKSFYNTHYKLPKIGSAQLSGVCLPNGLQLRLYSVADGFWAARSVSTCSITRYCTMQLPLHGPYSGLQFAVAETTLSPNKIISSQSICPRAINLHEFDAFVGLRSGHRVQWLNILRELRSRSLTLHNEEVHILLMQSAWQIGPLSDTGLLEAHSDDLPTPEYGLALLDEMDQLLHNVSANWLEVVTVKSLIMLTNRLLAASSVPKVTDKAYQLLRTARKILLMWTRELAKKLEECVDEKQIDELRQRVCEMATTCRWTYDVDNSHLICLLNTDEDVSDALECGIRIYDNTPDAARRSLPQIKRLLGRDRRLSWYLEPWLKSLIASSRAGVDRAVATIWPSYCLGTPWKQYVSPNDRWVTTNSGSSEGFQVIHLDTISGRLLIDGKPAGRLARKIMQHETYIRIFRNRILDVIPAGMMGMQYASRSPVYGYQIFFSLSADSLVIRAKQGPTLLELIPHSVFQGDLPASFVNDHVHWLCLSSDQESRRGSIELRPLDTPWASSDMSWYLNLSLHDKMSQMRRKDTLLLDIWSPTVTMVYGQLKVLDERQHMHVTCPSGHTKAFSALLPRYRLQFFVNAEGDLESTQYPDMIIDPTQSSGTMIGLVNQLVLRPKNDILNGLARTRRVLIPQGVISSEHIGNHTCVQIVIPPTARIMFHEYLIDTDLCCLINKSSLLSKLSQVYLHALTSHCLPDPLTRRTGLEEALQLLQSGACWSFTKLSEHEVALLQKISSLTPRFAYYPPHLKTMQSVDWLNGMHPLSQHPLFSQVVEKIFRYSEDLKLFEILPQEQRLSDSLYTLRDKHLLARYASRCQYFHLPDMFSATTVDCWYPARDIIDEQNDLDSESKACTLSNLILRWPSRLDTCSNLFDMLKRLGTIHTSTEKMVKSSDWLNIRLKNSWPAVYNTLRTARYPQHSFQLTFNLCLFAYQSPENWAIMPTLLAFATNDEFSTIPPPVCASEYFDFSNGFEPQMARILSIVNRSSRLALPVGLQLTRDTKESMASFQRRSASHEAKIYSAQAEQLATALIEQWPCHRPYAPSLRNNSTLLFQQSDFMEQVQPLFVSLFDNLQFQNHIQDVQQILDRVHQPQATVPSQAYKIRVMPDMVPRPCYGVRLQSLLDIKEGPACPDLPAALGHLAVLSDAKRGDSPSLKTIITDMLASNRRIHQVYAEDLQTSQSLFSSQSTPFSLTIEHKNQCYEHLCTVSRTLINGLSPNTPRSPDAAIQYGGLWPRLTPTCLLRLLATKSRIRLSPAWKEAFLAFAQAILIYQRSQRLVGLALRESWDEFATELANTNVDSNSAHLDWALIQIEGNFMIRSLQLEVANAMTIPPSDVSNPSTNTILQLNMGEGKSSVIVPLVSVAIADGKKLCRVVVLKPLAGQMFRQLVERLGGLTNRRIFTVPFSRKVSMGPKQVTAIKSIFDECMVSQGVLVVQPENILSFKLMTIDKLLHSSPNEYRPMLECMKWLESTSRDLLDESDEILETRYQLIYTVGQQAALEDNPNRWTTIQQVLDLVEKYLQHHPQGIDVTRGGQGRFPYIRSLHAEGESQLVERIAQLTIGGELPNLAFGILSYDLRVAVLEFITQLDAIDHYDRLCQETGSFWKGILLLRGLLAHGILVYILKERRWRVDYGLDMGRTLLAVPYRAKDVPALRAEFGHPEVAIGLTCLAYYYSGLTEYQLRLTFDLLSKLDNPDVEYEHWTRKDNDIPSSLRNIRSINVEDADQWMCLVETFQYNKATIDFFLSSVVFPKEGKAFPQKLCTSGWDLAEGKANITTGFSGTNDNRYLLPTSIRQYDLGTLKSTNAKVLSCVLLPENNSYKCLRGPNGQVLNANGFLELITEQTPPIRVLLDVGAQMLELRNMQLAQNWLSLLPDTEAAVFFNEDDEIMVITQDGDLSPFYSSPYIYQLDRCIVYLDDAHTRGTDLKLPTGARAAVTLGPKVTKDRLIQGCMRMRKLGNGHTVMFFAPPEVDARIRQVIGKGSDARLEVQDIIRWAIHETCAQIEHNIPHWYNQGVDHGRRRSAWDDFLLSSGDNLEGLRTTWLQRETQSLEEMYGRRVDDTVPIDLPPRMDSHLRKLGFEMTSVGSRTVDEEQEREVSHEVELERQVQRPPDEVPEEHHIHPSVRRLVTSGVLDPESQAFINVARFFNVAQFKLQNRPLKLLATRDFMATVVSSRATIHVPSDYLRPIKWLVSHHSSGYLIIFSPWEVNELLPIIRQKKAVTLHIYAPRVTLSMKPFDDLKVYNVPALSSAWSAPQFEVMCLNLVAGQLYLRDYDEYLRICMFLGRYSGEDDDDIPKQVDGFIKPAHRRRDMKRLCGFIESPIDALKELVSARRKGLEYRSSHIGKILHSAILRPENFE